MSASVIVFWIRIIENALCTVERTAENGAKYVEKLDFYSDFRFEMRVVLEIAADSYIACLFLEFRVCFEIADKGINRRANQAVVHRRISRIASAADGEDMKLFDAHAL